MKNINTPDQIIENRIIDSLKHGIKVMASIRGFRVSLSPIAFFYIEITAISSQEENLEIGFWPGITQEIEEAENTLKTIKKLHPKVTVVHNEELIYVRDRELEDCGV